MKNRLASIVAAVALLGACSAEPAPSVGHIHGEPLEAGERPSVADCQLRLRSDLVAAARIRKSLQTPGIAADDAAIRAAAADPDADLVRIGVPLTARELQALQASGMALDPGTALSYWTRVGAPELFGGIWVEPPGSNQMVVAVVDGDPQALALARCLEEAGVRYVWSAISYAAGEALKDRIAADIHGLLATGVEVNTVDYDELRGVVTVGVTRVTPGLQAQFVERYGQPIVVIEQSPIQPL
jgi:hypothetical protein